MTRRKRGNISICKNFKRCSTLLFFLLYSHWSGSYFDYLVSKNVYVFVYFFDGIIYLAFYLVVAYFVFTWTRCILAEFYCHRDRIWHDLFLALSHVIGKAHSVWNLSNYATYHWDVPACVCVCVYMCVRKRVYERDKEMFNNIR